MSDAADDGEVDGGERSDRVDAPADADEADAETTDGAVADGEATDEESIEALREQVETEYDFENFGPSDMASMSAEEWEAVFDAESWITGQELLDRVEVDLKRRVAEREVFARIERQDDSVLAYSDEGYATVYADGSVEGHGTVLRDVKPTVALASMESYEVPAAPPDDQLPEPQEVPEGSGELGNTMLQVVAGIQVLAGLLLLGGWLAISLGVVQPPGGGSIRSLNVIAMLVAGVLFLAIGLLLFAVVANARLSDKFRAEEYRNRLRAVELEPGERPEFLPDEADVPETAQSMPGAESEGLPGGDGDRDEDSGNS